jgi:FtsP/CotA-like multicopper oxidase with cupredoxin domain
MRPPQLPISRRTVLAGLAAAAIAPAPLAAQGDGFRVIRARSGTAKLRGEDITQIRGLNGVVPGPVLRVKRGEELKVRLVNELVVDTAIHWHGVRLPNPMDGVPGLTQPAVHPGESFDYRFTPRDAGTFWYHAPSRSLEDRALYGLLIVDEAEPVSVDRDVSLVLDAWTLGSDGRLAMDGAPHFTANGLSSLDIPVSANERLRLRLLNAARNRLITVRTDRHAATVMAIDGQAAEPFMARDGRVILSPGNRIDVFIDAALSPGSTAAIFVGSDDREVPVARLVYEAGAPGRGTIRPEAKPLPANPLPERMNLASGIKLEISLDDPRHRLDGVFGRPLFTTVPRQTITLALKNPTDRAHAVHLHGHHVRLLDALDDGWKPFWLDTILAPPQRTTRVAFVADNRGKWLIESDVIGADGGIRAWFEVT